MVLVLGVVLHCIGNDARVDVARAHVLEVVTADGQLPREPTPPARLNRGQLLKDSIEVALLVLIERGRAQEFNGSGLVEINAVFDHGVNMIHDLPRLLPPRRDCNLLAVVHPSKPTSLVARSVKLYESNSEVS